MEYAVLAATAINCEVREHSVSRAELFLSGLPKGYQIWHLTALGSTVD